MTRREFLRALSKRLSDMNKKDREDVLQYYNELILDKLDRSDEDEEDIIASLGSVDSIARKVSKGTYQNSVHISIDDEPVRTYNHRKKKNGLMVFISVCIAMVLIPVMFALGIAVGVTIIGIFIASFGIILAGIYVGVTGIVLLFSNLSMGLFNLGLGVVTIGVGIILAPIISKLIIKIFKCLVFVGKSVCRGISNIGGASYEN